MGQLIGVGGVLAALIFGLVFGIYMMRKGGQGVMGNLQSLQKC